jgi:hypothetical protein
MLKQIATVGVLMLAPLAAAADGVERSLTLETEATVLKVFAETRTVVLENQSTGATEFIKAGPEVKNFAQIEAGDKVKAVFTVGIAARMAVPGEVDSVTELDALAAAGEKPGGLTGTAVTLVLEFVSFDPATSVALVKTSDGAQEEIEVQSDEGREFASGLAAGDKVALTFLEGAAVGIVEQ